MREAGDEGDRGWTSLLSISIVIFQVQNPPG